MGWMTKYGSFWGMLPQTNGNVYWVGPGAGSYTLEGRTYYASDNNDGLSPERAFATVNRVFDSGKASANAGDVAVLLPGSHAGWTQDIAGVTVMGLPRGSVTGPRDHGAGVMAHAASVTTAITVTAANSELAYLHIVPAASAAGLDVAASNVNMHDLTFLMTTAEATDTFGISFTGASNRTRIANCYAYVEGNQGPWVRCAAAAVSGNGNVIENSTVVLGGSSAWDDVIEITTGVRGLVIRDCDFMASSGAVMTDVIDVTGNTEDQAVLVARCIVPVTSDGVQATATSDIQLAINYIATIEGGTGGTLVS